MSGYFCEYGFGCLFCVFSFFVEVKVVSFLWVASLLVPVAYQRLSFEFAGVIGCLLYDEVSVHLLSYNLFYKS